jgi:hypothetical protein
MTECANYDIDGKRARRSVLYSGLKRFRLHYNFVRIHQTLKMTPGHGGERHSQALGDV